MILPSACDDAEADCLAALYSPDLPHDELQLDECVNPWDLERSVGGSGASIAAGIAPISIGGDDGGYPDEMDRMSVAVMSGSLD